MSARWSVLRFVLSLAAAWPLGYWEGTHLPLHYAVPLAFATGWACFALAAYWPRKRSRHS